MIKYVVFDFDGTLADTKGVFVSAWNQLTEKYGYKKLELNQLDTLKKLTIKERSELLGFPMYKIPFVMPELLSLYKHSIPEIKLFDGIQELLVELQRKGFKIAIISSNSSENINEFLKRNNLEGTITNVLTSSRIFGKDKVINKFLKTNKLNPDEIIYVGDEYRDIVACKKSNVKMIWVEWGYDGLEVIQSANPDYKVSHPEEIVTII